MDVTTIYKTMEYGPAPESSKEALEFIAKHDKKFKLFIGNKWVNPSSNQYFDSIDPSNGEILCQLADADESDVDKAVQAAKQGLNQWSKLGGHGRARYLYAIARQIQKHSRILAVLESIDNGKPIRETRDIDIPLVARHFYHHAGWAQIMDTEMSEYKELGVVGQIIPWNFPLLMLSWKIAPALAMGNTVVLKPAEFTSLTAIYFAEICKNVGLPEGVVNIITGHGHTGAALVNHPDIAKIAFTGSTEVGKIIRKSTAGTGKKLSLELGGKSPFIVFEDADLDSVVEGIVDAIWFNQGQVCCAGSRLLVEESIADKLYEKIRARMENLRVGKSLDKCIDIGAIVAAVQLETIDSLVKKGVEEGCSLWQPSWSCPKLGYFYPPTLFTNVSPSSSIAQVEIFGPVLVAMSFRSHTEAVKLANNSRYGLAASIWTENINLALDVAPQLKAGTVWINSTNVFDAAAGFGGYRESGFGREGGREGLYEYVKRKSNDLLSNQSFEPKKVKPTKKEIALLPPIDRTPKLYIGGKQVRPDGGNSQMIKDGFGNYVGELPVGNRKDIRNAVEAAHQATSWGNLTGHARAQVLYFMAENLSIRHEEFANRIQQVYNYPADHCAKEVQMSVERIFYYAAMADKYDGKVHHTITKNVTLAMPEKIGVLGVVCPQEFPLLSFVSTIIPCIAMGNTVVAVTEGASGVLATDLYQVFETSDLPGGVINIITGSQDELGNELAKHNDVDGIWYFGSSDGSKNIELLSVENLKRTWVNHGKFRNWMDHKMGQGHEFIWHAIEIKNIWVPYGA